MAVMITFLRITRLVVHQSIVSMALGGLTWRLDLSFHYFDNLFVPMYGLSFNMLQTLSLIQWNLSSYVCDWFLGTHRILHSIFSLKSGVTFILVVLSLHSLPYSNITKAKTFARLLVRISTEVYSTSLQQTCISYIHI
jgi:hypothetical protein